MATPKPLTLRSQQAHGSVGSRGVISSSLQAHVFVDNGVFHLSDLYTYAIPISMESAIRRGSIVKVPFASKTTIGVVESIVPRAAAGLKAIIDFASSYAINENLMKLVEKLSKEYVCTSFDLFRFLLPPLDKKKSNMMVAPISISKSSGFRELSITTAIGENPYHSLIARIMKLPVVPRIVIFPTVRELERCVSLLKGEGIAAIEFGSHLSVAQRRRAYDSAALGTSRIVVGTRSAVFAPLSGVEEIIVVDDSSEHYFEQKTPYWNLRDVARARAQIEGAALFWLSAAPSLEIVAGEESGTIIKPRHRRFLGSGARFKVTSAPSSYLPLVRQSLRRGSVLVSVAEKGFSNLFICQRCRSVARCSCGGRIAIASRGVFVCSLCDVRSREWRCNECHATRFAMLRTGTEKVVEELGKSLPGVPIFLSTADKAIDVVPNESSVVVATSGMQPWIQEGYAAIVLLNGEELISRPFVRAEEELLQRWFRTLGSLKGDGVIYSSLPSQHRVSQSILAGDPRRYLVHEFEQRKFVELPPWRDLIVIESRSENLSSLRNKLQSEFSQTTAYLSPNGKAINLMVPKSAFDNVLFSLRALQKLRSVNKKELLRISRNPSRF